MRMTVAAFRDAVARMDDSLYRIIITSEFKKSLARSYRRNLDLGELAHVVHILATGRKLNPKYRPHALKGFGMNIRECHIRPDWLLVWQQNDDELILILLDTGTHSDLFG